VIFGVQRLLTWHQLFDSVLDGIKIMVPALTIIVMAFMFKTVNDQLGMPSYVIETISPWMTATTLPVLTFITLAFVSFATGSSWGIFVIAIPVVMPLGAAAGVDTTLMVGAVMSASAFGSHACFYSDATVLAAQGSGCSVMSHAITQIPYVLIAAGFAAVGLTLLS
jgi:Na+/H+ antiporter NhaC